MIGLNYEREKMKFELELTDSASREIERVRVSTGSVSIAEVLRKSILLLNTVDKQGQKGFDRLIMENSHTGKSVEITNFWAEL